MCITLRGVSFQCYSQCEQLLDVDAVAGSGVYRPDVPDPEMSCSSSTSLWELADLRVSTVTMLSFLVSESLSAVE